ncbi:MAG TPA: tetratricopeptide repeat protein [Ruminococcus flavefaciens]|nr:tetratricopeptide repeat protein [Ruminococcus flavefaciens]
MFVKLALADKPDDKMQIIKEYFSKLDSKLLVFIDNADTMTKEERKRLNSCKCRMIITSRQKIDGFYGVNINSPSSAYCKEMYIRESRGNNWDGYSLDEEKYINKITELANYHTQTVMLIAKAQYCLGLSSEEMLDELNNTGFVLKGNDEIIDTDDYELTMAEHMTKIFNLLNITDETQLKTIRLFSLLAPNTPIKKRDIKKWFELGSLSSINELVKYGWLNSSGSEYVSIHPIIADVVKYNHKPDFDFALPLINALQEEMKSADDYIKKNAVIVHAVAVAKLFESVDNNSYAIFLYEIAMLNYYNGTYNDSLNYYKKALSLMEKLLGKEHPDVANCYSIIGALYSYSGYFDQGLEYLHKALLIREKVLGIEHPDTAEIYNNIGVYYYYTGNYQKALEYFQKILDGYEKKHGSEQPLTADYCNNLGALYSKIGDYSKSLIYYNKSLYIRERIFGKEHPNTAQSYNNIGIVFRKQGEYVKALESLSKGLFIREKVLGKNHPETAHSYNHIGLYYSAIDNYNKAIEYYNKSIDIRKKTLGINHPDTAQSYNNIGVAFKKKGDYSNALEYLNKALAIRRELLGKNHQDTIETQKHIDEIQKLLSEKE